MQRLLSALRDSQNDCIDTECDNGLPGGDSSGFGLPMLLTLWGIAALVLFLTRPSSLRSNGRDRQAADEKQRIHRVCYIPCTLFISVACFQDDDPPMPPPDVQ